MYQAPVNTIGQARSNVTTGPTIVANFGYNESNKVPLTRYAPPPSLQQQKSLGMPQNQ